MGATPLTLDFVCSLIIKEKATITEEELKQAEETLLSNGRKLAAEKNSAGLQELMIVARPFYEVVGRVKAAKLIRELVELCLSVNQPPSEKIALVKSSIKWAKENSRVFLRRTLEARMIRLLNEQRKYAEAMAMTGPLVSELKKLEDRELLMEVTLEESRSAFGLKNLAKAKTSLILAKTSSNGCFVSPAMQAAIDLQSGILYSADEKDFRTAFSYYYEALEGFDLANDKKNVIRALKYMCLCKIMSNEAEVVPQLLATKICSQVKGRDIDAVVEMANAFKKRCLKSFQKCLEEYKAELVNDQVVEAHSIQLDNSMLEKEITRMIEPFLEVELSYIIKKVDLPAQRIEKAISMMILDKKIYGYIDQHKGSLRVFTLPAQDKAYLKANELIKALNKTIDSTYLRAAKIK